jgi:hypothetical protein
MGVRDLRIMLFLEKRLRVVHNLTDVNDFVLYVYRETVWYFESERFGDASVLRRDCTICYLVNFHGF